MNFPRVRDQILHLETAANLCASRRQAIHFLQFGLFFGLEVITEHLMIGLTGNREFCFPSTLNVPQGEAKGNTQGLGETKLIVSPKASH